MKPLTAKIILTLALLILSACQVRPLPGLALDPNPNATASAGPVVDPFTADWNDRGIFQSSLIRAEQGALQSLPGATVYRIHLQISDDLLHVTGHQAVRYTNRENTSLNEIYFRLFPNAGGSQMTVSAVKVNDQVVELVYEFKNSAARVPLPSPLPPGQQVTLEMDFAVHLSQKGGGNYSLVGYFDDVLMLDGIYPMIPVYNERGWNVEELPANADTTFNDVSFYLVQVTAPANLVLAASGIEVEHKNEANRQIITLAIGPARDFYMGASPKYKISSTNVGETIINSYVLDNQAERAEMVLGFAGNAMRSYNEQLGPYPYTEFDVLSMPIGALGIEYPGIVGIAQELYDPERKVGGVSSQLMLESTVAHEAGHQWFYNMVGDDQIDEPWLDESFAQYVTTYYYTNVYGQNALWNTRTAWDAQWQQVGREDKPIGLPAAAYTHDEYGGIVYGRGPLFINTLAETMGQRTFDDFLRDYVQTYKWSITSTEAFKQMAEQHCQCDLTPLFQKWVYPK